MAAVIFGALYPLIPLWPVHLSFSGDWPYHIWPIGFMKRYFAVHHHLPALVSSREMVFLPAQIFYAHVLYPALALFALVLGASAALRFAAAALMLFQVYCVWRLFEKLTNERWFAVAAAWLTVWAIYPLTNLYNRSAIPEFFAAGLLFCVLSLWLLVLFEKESKRLVYGIVGGCCLAVSVGIHPITALFGSFFLAVVMAATSPWLIRLPKKLRLETFYLSAFAVAVTAVLNAPWAFANWVLGKKIAIVARGLWLTPYLADIDAWRTRFSLFPTDVRLLATPFGYVPNPYLDAQINLPLLLLCGFVFVLVLAKGPRRKLKNAAAIFFAITSAALFVFTTVMSLNPRVYDQLPAFAKIIQFMYRMITYQNLSLTLLLAALVTWNPGIFEGWAKNGTKFALLVCVCLSAAGVAIKINHARAVQAAMNLGSYLNMPAKYDTALYISASIPPLTLAPGETVHDAAFDVLGGDDYGNISSREIEGGGWFQTNVAAFDWNKIYVDGKRVPDSGLRNANRFLALQVPSGKHVLSAAFEPDKAWSLLRALSFPSAVCFTILFYFFIKRWSLRGHR